MEGLRGCTLNAGSTPTASLLTKGSKRRNGHEVPQTANCHSCYFLPGPPHLPNIQQLPQEHCCHGTGLRLESESKEPWKLLALCTSEAVLAMSWAWRASTAAAAAALAPAAASGTSQVRLHPARASKSSQESLKTHSVLSPWWKNDCANRPLALCPSGPHFYPLPPWTAWQRELRPPRLPQRLLAPPEDPAGNEAARTRHIW